jgi:hypothetical protein
MTGSPSSTFITGFSLVERSKCYNRARSTSIYSPISRVFLLTVLAVLLSRLDRRRFVVRDKHIGVQTEQVGNNRTVEGRRRLRGYSDGSPLVKVRTKAKRGRVAM